MKTLTQIVCILFFAIPVIAVKAADTLTVAGPDQRIRFQLFDKDGQLSFCIRHKHTMVIEPSPLIFSVDGNQLTKDVKKASARRYIIRETYPWYGVHSTAINNCNGLELPLNCKGITYRLDIRVFNDGAAFRLTVPADGTGKARVLDEGTVFNIPRGSIVWHHDMEMHYESVHSKTIVDSLPAGTWVAPPGTLALPENIYAAVTEANLTGYPGMALQANGKRGLEIRLAQHQPVSYPYRLRYSAADTLRLKQPAAIAGAVVTPWRVIMVGTDLNSMVNNDMVHNLCPPPDPTLFPQGVHTGWIKPGRAVWKYLNGGGDGTLPVMKHFTDGAAALGFEHNILEGFWTKWTDDEIRELVSYSKTKNVSIWFWVHSKNLRKVSTRDSLFARCHELGVAGLKIDFFDHEAKEVIDLYDAILKETARYHLMVDFHGANKPTGLSRTWPNEMVREAVKGMEASKLTDRATHETTLPFTRLLAGPAEYTVVHFGERKKNTTWAHQLASAAILNAPLLTYAVNPDTVFTNIPATAMIESIPAVWDETIVLPASGIGELAVFARRKGNRWFLAVMNGINPRLLNLSLSFLPKGSFRMTALADDGASPASLKPLSGHYSAKDQLQVDLVTGGGFIARFDQQKEQK